jgi:hypothetical protein
MEMMLPLSFSGFSLMKDYINHFLGVPPYDQELDIYFAFIFDHPN